VRSADDKYNNYGNTLFHNKHPPDDLNLSEGLRVEVFAIIWRLLLNHIHIFILSNLLFKLSMKTQVNIMCGVILTTKVK